MNVFPTRYKLQISIIFILVIQFLLIYYTFNLFFIHPTDYLFQNQYDGIKNYFNFYQYVTNPKSNLGWFGFQFMNYPYGEYIFYTDNTPFLSFPIKLLNQIFPLGNYNFTLFNFLFILNIPLCSIMFFLLLKDKVKNLYLLIFSAICLAWINPQLQRLGMGHFNLSMSSFVLMVIYGLYKVDIRSNQNKSIYSWAFFIAAVLFMASFFHFYFLPILMIPIGGYILYKGIGLFNKKQNHKYLIQLASFISLSILSIYALIRIVDTYYSLRANQAGGYGYHLWKLIPEAIIKPYSCIHTLPFPLVIFNCQSDVPYESMSYFGIFIISALLVGVGFFFYYLFKNKLKLKLFIKNYCQKNLFWVIIFISGLMSYFISMGDYVNWCNHIRFENFLNPFYFIKFDLLTQFRCLGRFVWIFFWSSAFAAIFIMDYVLKKTENHKFLHYFILFLSFIFLSADTYDITLDRKNLPYNFLNNSSIQESLAEIDGKINFQEFQSILCIPIYRVGAENSKYIIDDIPRVSDFSYQISIKSKLPLMDSKLSRTVESQAKSILNIIEDGHIPKEVKSKLNPKSILVIKDLKQHQTSQTGQYLDTIKAKEQFIDVVYKMDTLYLSKDSMLYLSWDWVKNN